jgi:hypothetical protein
MLKVLFTAIAVCLFSFANAQIIGPDTVVVNTSAQFTTTNESPFYSWTNDTVDIDQPLTPANYVAITSSLNTAAHTTISYDNGNYYSFVLGYINNVVYKLSYGSSPLNTPTLTNMGTFGLSSNQTDGIDIVKDSATGNWHMFIAGGSQLLRLDFGTSLSNTPTSAMMIFTAYLFWPQQIALVKDAGQWVLFVANRNTSLSRFDFGSSLTNTPTGFNFAITGGLNKPVGFSLYKQAGNWYMLVLNLVNATITRLEFGTNLQNNTPAGVNVGNPGNLLALPRGSTLLSDCNQLIGYIQLEAGNIIKLDFQNDVTNNTPIATIAGSTLLNYNNNIIPFFYNDSLYWLRTNSNNYLFRTFMMAYPTGTTGGFNDKIYNHTYTQIGTYDLTLHCGQGTTKGPESYCKQVVVMPDTTLNTGITKNSNTITLYPNPSDASFVIKGGFRTKYAKANIRLMDMLGRIVLSEETEIKNNSIEQIITTDHLPAGNYLLSISSPDNYYTLHVTHN